MRFILGFIIGLLPVFAHADNISLKSAVLHGLDKVTGRLSTMTVNVGEKATFGALDVYVRVCFTHPPEETPEHAAYLDIVENHPEGQTIPFSGWMFASSPALSAMEHAVYDIWVVKCTGDEIPVPKAEKLELPNLLKEIPTVSKLRIQNTVVKEVSDEELKEPATETTSVDENSDEGKATLIPLDEPQAVPEKSDIIKDLVKDLPDDKSVEKTEPLDDEEGEKIIDELSGEVMTDSLSEDDEPTEVID